MAESQLLHAYGYLTAPEIRFPMRPSSADTDRRARQAGKTQASPFTSIASCSARGARTGASYRSGPWLDGTPEQGFQSRSRRRSIYRIGIRDIITRRHLREAVRQAPADKQDDVLKAPRKEPVELRRCPRNSFRSPLAQYEEVSSRSLYGGNRNKVDGSSWAFPACPRSYRDQIDNPALYHAEPVSILTFSWDRRGRCAGLRQHIMIKREGGKT